MHIISHVSKVLKDVRFPAPELIFQKPEYPPMNQWNFSSLHLPVHNETELIMI